MAEDTGKRRKIALDSLKQINYETLLSITDLKRKVTEFYNKVNEEKCFKEFRTALETLIQDLENELQRTEDYLKEGEQTIAKNSGGDNFKKIIEELINSKNASSKNIKKFEDKFKEIEQSLKIQQTSKGENESNQEAGIQKNGNDSDTFTGDNSAEPESTTSATRNMKESDKEKALLHLQNLQKETCEPLNDMRMKVEEMLQNIRPECGHDMEQNVTVLLSEIEEELKKIQYTASTVKLEIDSEPSDSLEIANKFENQKTDSESAIGSFRSRIDEIEKEFEKYQNSSSLATKSFQIDEKENRQECLLQLEKLQDGIVQECSQMKTRIQTLSQKCGIIDDFSELLSEVDQLESELDTHLETVQNVFEEQEIKIKRSPEGNDLWNYVETFSEKKKEVSSRIKDISQKLRNLEKSSSKLSADIEKKKADKEKKNEQLKNLFKNLEKNRDILLKEIQFNVDGLNTEHKSIRIELNILRSSVNDIFEKVEKHFDKHQDSMNESNDKSTMEKTLQEFEKYQEDAKQEFSEIRKKVAQILKPDSSVEKTLFKLNQFYEEQVEKVTNLTKVIEECITLTETSQNKEMKKDLEILKKEIQEFQGELDLNFGSTKENLSQPDKNDVDICFKSFCQNIQETWNKIECKFNDLVVENEKWGKTPDKTDAVEQENPLIAFLKTSFDELQVIFEKEKNDLHKLIATEKHQKTKFEKNLRDIEQLQKKFQEEFDEMELKLAESNISDTEVQNRFGAEIFEKRENFEIKLKKICDSHRSFVECITEKKLTTKKLTEKLKTIYEKYDQIVQKKLQKLSRLTSSTEKETEEISEIRTQLEMTIKDFQNECESQKDKIYSSNTDEMLDENLTNLDRMSKQIEHKILEIQSKMNDFMTRKGISFQTILKESIRELSTNFGLQLDDKSGLHIFKLPFQAEITISADHLRSFEIGEPRPDKDHHHVMLVGMTGSGKSLLINNMINYIYGVNHEDTFRFKLIVESEEIKDRGAGAGSSQAESMTSWVTSYTFHWQEGFRIDYSFTIIDTPGFGDTRGLEYDEKIVAQIKKFVNSEALCPSQKLTSIGLVIQASQARITEEQRYIYNQALNMFGKDMTKNIFLVFTFADAQPPPALETVKSNKIPFAEGCHFKFNNSALYAPNDDRLSQHSWKFGYSNLTKYFDALENTEPVSLGLTKQVLDEQEHLQLTLEAIKTEIYNGMDTLALIENQSRQIDNLSGVIQSKRNFKIKCRTFRCEARKTSENITNCNRCKFTCHSPCHIKGNRKEDCAAFKAGFCTICPGKCHVDKHTNGDTIYKYIPVEREETIDWMMKQYNVALNDKDAKRRLMYNLSEKYNHQKQTILDCFDEASKCSRRLEELSLRSSNITNVAFIEQLIDSEKRSSNLNKENRLQQLHYFCLVAKVIEKAGVNYDPSLLPVNDYEEKMQIMFNKTLGNKPSSGRGKVW